MFEFQFELCNEDYYAFCKHHTYHTAVNKQGLRRSRYMIPLAYFAAAIVFGVIWQSAWTSVFCVAFGLLWLVFHDMLIDWRIKEK